MKNILASLIAVAIGALLFWYANESGWDRETMKFIGGLTQSALMAGFAIGCYRLSKKNAELQKRIEELSK